MTTSRPVFMSCVDADAAAQAGRHEVRRASARPSSHGVPACMVELDGHAAGAAVVAGDVLEAFATPAAIVPTPSSQTSFTLTPPRR